jgi:hypothetical protein
MKSWQFQIQLLCYIWCLLKMAEWWRNLKPTCVRCLEKLFKPVRCCKNRMDILTSKEVTRYSITPDQVRTNIHILELYPLLSNYGHVSNIPLRFTRHCHCELHPVTQNGTVFSLAVHLCAQFWFLRLKSNHFHDYGLLGCDAA